MKKEVVNFYGNHGTIGVCIEECCELVHALSKYDRACGRGFATKTDPEAAYKEVVKAIADATNAIHSVTYTLGVNPEEIAHLIQKSDEEALERIEEKSSPGSLNNGVEVGWND